MRFTHALTALAVLCFSAAACGGQSPRPVSATRAAAPGYPVTITNCDQAYTFTGPPGRTVLMSGGAVGEVSALVALGLESRIAANAQSYGTSDVPGRAAAIDGLPKAKILKGGWDISRESVLSLRPDLVIGTTGYDFDAQNGYATRPELLEIGANTWLPDSTCGGPGTVRGTQTIEDSYDMLRDFGRIYGVADRAEELVERSRRRIAEIEAKVRGGSRPKVMYIIPGMEMGTAEFSSIGANGIWNDIFEKAGGANAFGGVTDGIFANLSKEQVAKTAVDAVVIINWRNPDPDAEARKLLARFPQWRAARDGRYVVLSDSAYLGPDNAVAVERIARMLHPERF
ncbi:ABC transporter substrate-binding protein [Streptosporangium sp. NPDC051023]|uniref:ABC transporter substrate-binding protein n=1 Tax=Streptosporangium sp. NPDC051023 TaxID=3155410 RepID=UPI00344D22CB